MRPTIVRAGVCCIEQIGRPGLCHVAPLPLVDSPRYPSSRAMNPNFTEPACRSDYNEYPVSVPLRRHLLCFWTQSISGSHGRYSHRVLPDACIDIVFINDAAPLLVGPWQESFLADFAPGTKILGVRFHPGRAPGLLKTPAFALLNLSAPLREVCGQSALAQFARVLDQPSLPAKRASLEAVMSAWLSGCDAADRPVRGAVHWLACHPAGRIDQLCQAMGISPRQLHRRFLAAVGYGPKMFQSILRFQRVLHLASRFPAASGLAHVAAEAGYADQSHMTREVRRFSRKSPTALLGSARCTLGMSEFFCATDASS